MMPLANARYNKAARMTIMLERSKNFGRSVLIGISLCVIVLISTFWWYNLNYYPIDRFAGLKAEHGRDGRTIRITGHVMGSVYCIGRINARLSNGELNIRMRYRLICPSQRSGSFETEILVPHSPVRAVTYGDERSEIPGLR